LRTCDLQVAPRGVDEARGIAEALGLLGVRVVAVEAGSLDEARAYKRLMEEYGVEAYTRITVEAKTWQEAVKQLARTTGFDIVAVRPRSAEAARLAARDPRVAVVQLPPGMARYMDRSQVLMLREGGSVVEVRLLPLLRGGDPRTAMRGIMVVVRRASAYGAPFIVSSGARSKWELWSPASARAMLEAMGVPSNIALLALTSYCRVALKKAGR
jgi:ribonuclease P/MRP protein subunit RPP1